MFDCIDASCSKTVHLTTSNRGLLTADYHQEPVPFEIAPGCGLVHTASMDELRKEILRYLAAYGLAVIGALIILAVGIFVARWLGRVFGDWLANKRVEPPVRILAVRVVRLLVFAMAAVLALDKLHVPIAPMVAGIGVAGVGIGLATQGVLSNIVAGLTIIFTKPFRFGQYIQLLSLEGQVEASELVTTRR